MKAQKAKSGGFQSKNMKKNLVNPWTKQVTCKEMERVSINLFRYLFYTIYMYL